MALLLETFQPSLTAIIRKDLNIYHTWWYGTKHQGGIYKLRYLASSRIAKSIEDQNFIVYNEICTMTYFP
jgi:hypothetical protein